MYKGPPFDDEHSISVDEANRNEEDDLWTPFVATKCSFILLKMLPT